MPSFETEVEFEVFCECGEGLCNNCETRISHTRQFPQLVVEPCEKCIESAKEEVREELRAEFDDEMINYERIQ